jgi:ammonia channel protein AmtB
MASIIVGPRIGRFDAKRGKPADFAPSSPVFQALGTFILWLGW